MITGSIIAHRLSIRARRRSAPLRRGGRSICSRRATSSQATQRARAIIRPGAIPARNSLVIETPPTTPNSTKPMLGGMIGPMIEAEAISPPDRAALWPDFSIIGSSRALSAAASARAEPDRLDSRQAARMTTKPSPPRIWPTSAMARSTMRRDRPPVFITSPASMKNGTAISGKLSAPLITFWATIWESNRPRWIISATPLRIRAKAIGMPIAMVPSSDDRKTATTTAQRFLAVRGPRACRGRRAPRSRGPGSAPPARPGRGCRRARSARMISAAGTAKAMPAPYISAIG